MLRPGVDLGQARARARGGDAADVAVRRGCGLTWRYSIRVCLYLPPGGMKHFVPTTLGLVPYVIRNRRTPGFLLAQGICATELPDTNHKYRTKVNRPVAVAKVARLPRAKWLLPGAE